MKPLAVDLCAGLGGWTHGLLAEGWDCVGFDTERHEYGAARYPAQLVLQDIRTLDGRQFRGKVKLIVASPPCQKYSYMAMPWTRSKALIQWYRDPEHPERIAGLNELFDACIRIGREAECPIIIENVRGAQPWVGRAAWRYGSFYLWGDVPALMPIIRKSIKGNGGPWFRDADSADGTYGPGNFRQGIEGATKNGGGSWFNVAHNTLSGKGQNPDGRCICPKDCDCANPGGRGVAHLSNECPVHNFNPLPADDCPVHGPDGFKTRGHLNIRDGHSHTRHLTNPSEHDGDGVKFSQSGDAWFDGKPRDKMLGHNGPAAYGSKSSARKAASAHIANIPLPLARHIARAWFPE
jgi:C-5 cytosine-specific DNA methylase